jgi:CheY-like chemotaxis protein
LAFKFRPMKSPRAPIWTMMLRELFTHGQESAALSRLSEAAVAPPGPAESSHLRRTVLVVDDDPDIVPIVELALGHHNFETEGVTDGAAALARLRLRDYDLVVLDLGMAELDGFEVLQAIKKEMWRETPVIVLTADHSDEALARSFGYGADDFVSKPFKPIELGIRAYRLMQPQPSPMIARPPHR